jgi:anti-sigma regulatory factor (Ser/Thr protein kinase)
MTGPLETSSLTRRPPAASGQADLGDWPLHSYLELPAVPESVRAARSHAAQTVSDWGLQTLSDDVVLVVSELVTNAVRATSGLPASQHNGRSTSGLPPIQLRLYSDRQQLVIEVWDDNDRPPVRKSPDLEDDSGRGLELIDAICQSWGTFASADSCGKAVWAVLSLG